MFRCQVAVVMMVMASLTVLAGTASADSSRVGPKYIGDRSANPEQETFANLVRTEGRHLLVFIGPAQNIGAVTSDPEKDTFAYQPLLRVKGDVDGAWLA